MKIMDTDTELLKDYVTQILRWEFMDKQAKADTFPFSSERCSELEWDKIHSVFKEHAIAPLVYDILRFIPDEYSELKNEWAKSSFANIQNYLHIEYQQKELVEQFRKSGIPIVVLKGTSAAKYYPSPQLRTMGDIDLLVKPNDFDRASYCLIRNGCVDITNKGEEEKGRHRSYRCNNTLIELHHIFGSKIILQKPELLDELLFSAMPDADVCLPDVENGIVLLAHIAQHLGYGLGFRQIIDWMMYVKSFLNDDVWNYSFREKAHELGLESLAITVTKMCKKYLGLPHENFTWCDDADEKVCDELLMYIFGNGNFGRSRELHQSSLAIGIPSFKHPIRFMKFLQSRGEKNWRALRKHKWLKPFAWIYQTHRFAAKVINNSIGVKEISDIYSEKNKRKEMLNQFGLQTKWFIE